MITDKLTEADFDYFSRAMGDLKHAQSIVDFVKEVLMERYGLKTGDQITPDGHIERAPSEAPQ